MRNGITREESTVLKAIAILTVVLVHAIGVKAFESLPVLDHPKFAVLLCKTGMCIFLLLSGYGLFCSYEDKGLNNWWDSKVRKIFLPAVLVQVIWYLLTVAFSLVKEGTVSVSWETLFGDLFCLTPQNEIDGTMWYLSYLLFCYALFFVCFRFLPDKVKFLGFVVVWFILIPFAVKGWISGSYCISSFGIGVIWGKLAATGKIQLNAVWKVVISVICLIVAVFYFLYPDKTILVDNVAGNIIAMGFIIFFSMVKCDKLRLLQFIGKNSFFLYLLEGKTIFLFPFSSFAPGLRPVLFVALLTVSIALAALLGNVNKKMN